MAANQVRIVVLHAASVERERVPQALHALSTSVRRLRTLLCVAQPLLPEGMTERWAERIMPIAALADSTRHWDILIEQLLPGLGSASGDIGCQTLIVELAAAALERRDRARRTAARGLRALNVAGLLAECLRELETAARISSVQGTVGGRKFKPFAQDAVWHARQRAHRAAARCRRRPRRMQTAQRALTDLLYLTEFFAPSLPRRSQRRLSELARWHRQMSWLDDLAALRKRLPELMIGEVRDDTIDQDAPFVMDSWLKQLLRTRRKEFARGLRHGAERVLRG